MQGIVKGGLNDGNGSNVKSSQRGETIVSTTTVDVVISEVDIDKSIVELNIYASSTSPASSLISAELINPTTLRLYINTTGATAKASWQVTEFNNVKSLQKGTSVVSTTGTNVTISTVNLNKSLLIASCTSTNTTGSGHNNNHQLSSPTNINFEIGNPTVTYKWQVIEFD